MVKRNNMRKLFLCALMAMAFGVNAMAQAVSPFVGTIYNKEYSIYLTINAVDKNVVIPNQEVMGEMVGYIGDQKDFRKWLILDCEEKTKKSLVLQITNDEGSEDLEALLSCENDSVYKLKQLGGSTLKIARNRKWQKLPQTLEFVSKQRKP